MNIFNILKEQIVIALGEMIDEGYLPKDVALAAVTAEPPRDPSHGDIATNAAMVVAKKAGKKPADIAEILAEKLKSSDFVDSIEIAAPGFINFRLKSNVWYEIIKIVLEQKTAFGNSSFGKGEKVNIEYVSANPTGPMHVGHGRGAVVGDVTASILSKVGYDVTKEYYVNDAGGQIDVLAKSAYLRYREACGENIEIPEGFYPGDYLIPIGKDFADLHKASDLKPSLATMRSFALEGMMDFIRADLSKLGVTHDVFTSEKELVNSGAVENSIDILDKKGLVYKGILEPPKGKLLEDWEPREQVLFRSTNFGDDVDRPLKKSDGSGTYFSSDIAYHNDKLERGFNKMILVLGADHGGYVKRLKAIVKALSDNKAEVDVLLYQLVNFLEDGTPMKMSKRAGTYITIDDVINAVGKDVMRFIMLTRKSDVTLDFDLKKVTEQSKDNPVFYVQYAHARIQSVLRKAASFSPTACGGGRGGCPNALHRLTDKNEIALMKIISEWPRVVENAAVKLEPHRIAFYLQDLASVFHALWNIGKDNSAIRFLIEEDEELTMARLSLIKACAITIASGLEVMGIEPVKEM